VSPMPFEGRASFRWRPWFCQALSVALHAAFFLAGGFLLTVAAEFGVDAGTGGRALAEPQEMHAEVEIVEYEATPKVLPVVEESAITEEPVVTQEPVVAEEQVVTEEPVVAEEPSVQEEIKEPEMPPVPQPSPTATPESVVAQETDQWVQPAAVPTPIAKPPRRKAVASGKPGSAPPREKAAASSPATAASGAKSARADYLRNPPPVYPAEAKRNGQQRVALFRVVVSAAGHAESVTLIKSSGYRILDASALEAVRKWKFHPATIGGVKVSSTVKVPVRFTLD
jgi:protein TonB